MSTFTDLLRAKIATLPNSVKEEARLQAQSEKRILEDALEQFEKKYQTFRTPTKALGEALFKDSKVTLKRWHSVLEKNYGLHSPIVYMLISTSADGAIIKMRMPKHLLIEVGTEIRLLAPKRAERTWKMDAVLNMCTVKSEKTKLTPEEMACIPLYTFKEHKAKGDAIIGKVVQVLDVNHIYTNHLIKTYCAEVYDGSHIWLRYEDYDGVLESGCHLLPYKQNESEYVVFTDTRIKTLKTVATVQHTKQYNYKEQEPHTEQYANAGRAYSLLSGMYKE